MRTQPDAEQPQIGRMPPQDINAEQCVLGSMMLSAPACADVLQKLAAKDFYRPQHETVFGTIAELAAAGKPTDATVVMAALIVVMFKFLRGLWSALRQHFGAAPARA